jgi:hypothetical protein
VTGSSLFLVGTGLALLALTAWRPAIGCAALVLAVPLTTGMGRGTILPLLRPNEAVLLIVVVGLLVGLLVRPLVGRTSLPLSGLDITVAGYAFGSPLIAWLVLYLGHADASFDTWRAALSPLQFLTIYLVFSRTQLSRRSVVAIINLALLAGTVVAVVAVAELLDVGGMRQFVATYYPSNIPFPAWDPVYRPSSTLGYYSSVGALTSLSFVLALALATTRQAGFRKAWLGFVMSVSVIGTLASLVWAPALALVPATGIVAWYGRRIPSQLGVVAAGLVLAAGLLGPSVAARAYQQGVYVGGRIPLVPQTLQYRLVQWNEFFLPALGEHPWIGTGTKIPSMVPESLTVAVDSEFLRQGFRAGILGLVLLISMLAAMAVTGFHCRGSPDPLCRALGAAGLAYAVVLVLIGVTGEYLTFGGVSQEIAMVTGLLVAWSRPAVLSTPANSRDVLRSAVVLGT